MDNPKPLNILQGYQLAASLHSGQKDKSGRPYIEHLSRVFLRVVEAGGTETSSSLLCFTMRSKTERPLLRSCSRAASRWKQSAWSKP